MVNTTERERAPESVRQQSFVRENALLGNRVGDRVCDSPPRREDLPLEDAWFTHSFSPAEAQSGVVLGRSIADERSSTALVTRTRRAIGDDIADAWFK